MKIECTLLLCLVFGITLAQHGHETASLAVKNMEPQPLLAQALRISEALTYIGNPLPPATAKALHDLSSEPMSAATVTKVQELLDPFCLATVQINPESRVKVDQGAAHPVLIQDGWTSYLIKVNNQAHITAALVAESRNAAPVLHGSSSAPRMQPANALTEGDIANRFLELRMYQDRPLKANLSGAALEYAVIQLYTRHAGSREAKLGFNVGQGSQDIGFRNEIDILFNIRPAVKVVFSIRDEKGSPTMASFIITDGIDRFSDSESTIYFPENYRLALAMARHWEEPRTEIPSHPVSVSERLSGIYPLPSRRLASHDTYPDFFFQPQVYRYDGEHVFLPPGKYHVTFGKGPEYKTQQQEINVPAGKDSVAVSFRLERWIHMAALGWFSADHHIHAAGCAHYESPEEGVLPKHMWRQLLGEDLNLGSNLTWGPSWYYQKKFFTGKDYPLSDASTILRYDVEVSGFPSSHAGHVVLLKLKEDDYPGTSEIEQWPTWTLPVLKWAKSQGGLTGYAHSGWGLSPIQPSDDLPNYVLPKMDGIGANEYVVTVVHNAVDFYSAGDTPAPAELNMWYHTLNCGFRTRLSGETDFPCISDERVGQARIYAKLNKLTFDGYMDAIKAGNSYVSEGYSHLIDFSVNGNVLGTSNSEVNVGATGDIEVDVKAAAFLTEEQDEIGSIIQSRNAYQSPYWHIERARIGKTRNVPVELIVNGSPVEKIEVVADGNWNKLHFKYRITRSSWVAVRIYQSSHTNPIFVIADKTPIRDKKSAAWCRDAVDQCWKMKVEEIRPTEQEAARQAYDVARKFYNGIVELK